MKKIFYSLIVLFLLSASILVGRVSAQSRLTYPIPDLGYCRDAKECYLYCEIPENKAACWSYGKYKVGNDVLGVTTMSEEEKKMMESKARQYNITFPIVDLGNCTGPQECRDFCENPDNQTTCMDFAKKKGFQRDMDDGNRIDRQKKDELIEKAKTELGCTSMESCSKVCETDHTRCETFAKKHGVYQEPPQSSGRYSTKEKIQLMEKAQSELGCTSMESCKSTCEQNPERCMAFAKKHGFDKEQEQREQGASSDVSPNYGTQRFGKGNCDSEESCKKYCQEHPDECPGFQGYSRATQDGAPSTSQTQPQSQGSYMGPSGCRTEAECKSYCETSPDKCPGFREGKAREESTKRGSREMMQQNYEYRPPGGGSPSYQPTTQPSSGTYAPPGGSNTIPVTP